MPYESANAQPNYFSESQDAHDRDPGHRRLPPARVGRVGRWLDLLRLSAVTSAICRARSIRCRSTSLAGTAVTAITGGGRVELWNTIKSPLLSTLFTPFPSPRSPVQLLRRLGTAEALGLARLLMSPASVMADDLFDGDAAQLESGPYPLTSEPPRFPSPATFQTGCSAAISD